jgi:hypothetical protein
MSVITVPVEFLPWHIVNPTVVRYLERRYVDDFFETGKLRIPSCKAFWKHGDEQRGDQHEALIRVVGTHTSGGRFDGSACFAGDSFVLSTSCVEDLAVGSTFASSYDAAIRILDPVGFGVAVARSVPGYKGGFQGFCRYRDSRTVELEEPVPDFVPPTNEADAKTVVDRLQAFVSGHATLHALLQKGLKYRSQNEYRFVWNSFEAESVDFLDIVVPEARQFCRRVISTPDGPDLTSNWAGAQVTVMTKLPEELLGPKNE